MSQIKCCLCGNSEKKINKYWYADKLSETEYLFQKGQ